MLLPRMARVLNLTEVLRIIIIKKKSYETYSYQKNGYLWKFYAYFLQMV